MGSHIRGNLEALSAATSATRPLPPQPSSSPRQHGSLRQTAITVTSGLAPAAGFAMGFGKRAVERMGRAFGSLGSGHNTSGLPTSFPLSAGTDFGLDGSNVWPPSHVSHAGKGKQRWTPSTAPSAAWSVMTIRGISTRHTESGSFGSTGPSLGPCLRGPSRSSAGGFVIGGLVFGRPLRACVQDTAIDAVRLAPPTSGDSQSGGAHTVPAPIVYLLILLCSLTRPSRAAAACTCCSLRGTSDEMGCRGRRSFTVRQVTVLIKLFVPNVRQTELAGVRHTLPSYDLNSMRVQILICWKVHRATWILMRWHLFSKLTFANVRDSLFSNRDNSNLRTNSSRAHPHACS
jgi:hypothetical protein